jgi:hypothetical protein
MAMRAAHETSEAEPQCSVKSALGAGGDTVRGNVAATRLHKQNVHAAQIAASKNRTLQGGAGVFDDCNTKGEQKVYLDCLNAKSV